MKRPMLFLAVFSLIVGGIQCDNKIVSDCLTCAEQQPAGQKITLSEIQQTIFNPQCISCHGGNQPAAGLNLSEGLAHLNLVNQQSTTAAQVRVVPNKSSASYLVWVLEGEKAPLMPPTGALSRTKIDSVIAWIDRGAENN